MVTALDYSQGRPSAAAVKSAGHVGVIRYVGTPGRTKNITRAEYADMTSSGVGVALVYENHDGDSAGGYSGGQAAARTARADADSVGWPRDRPIYFAVDSDQVTAPQFAAVSAYLDGAASVLGSAALVGVYGEYDVIEKNVGPHAAYGWQTAAWSGGKRSAKAALYQKIGTKIVGGVGCDENDILATDWGQHDGGDDMPTVKEIADGVVDAFMSREITVGQDQPTGPANKAASVVLGWTNNDTAAIRSMVAQLLAGAGGVTAAQIAAQMLPALTAAIVAEVGKVDAISDADAQQIADAVTARAGALLGGAA